MTLGRAPLHIASPHEDLNEVSNICTASGFGIVVDVKEDYHEVSNISWASGLDTGVAEEGDGDFDSVSGSLRANPRSHQISFVTMVLSFFWIVQCGSPELTMYVVCSQLRLIP